MLPSGVLGTTAAPKVQGESEPEMSRVREGTDRLLPVLAQGNPRRLSQQGFACFQLQASSGEAVGPAGNLSRQIKKGSLPVFVTSSHGQARGASWAEH